MKRITSTLIIALLALQLSAQENLLTDGEKVLNLGIGFGNALYSGTGYSSSMVPLAASFEVGIIDDFINIETSSLSVGGYIGYASYKWEYFGWGYKYTNLIIGPRASFHYPLVDRLDTYVGLLLAYNIVSTSDIGDRDPLYDYKVSSSGILFDFYVGGRYYFNDNIAAMLELGTGISYINLGVAFKL